MSLVQIFRREANRLRELATAFPPLEGGEDLMTQARHYDLLASQAASRQLPSRSLRSAVPA